VSVIADIVFMLVVQCDSMILFYITITVAFVLIAKSCLLEAIAVVVLGTGCALMLTAQLEIIQEWKRLHSSIEYQGQGHCQHHRQQQQQQYYGRCTVHM